MSIIMTQEPDIPNDTDDIDDTDGEDEGEDGDSDDEQQTKVEQSSSQPANTGSDSLFVPSQQSSSGVPDSAGNVQCTLYLLILECID